MPPRRRIDPVDGRAAVEACVQAWRTGATPPRPSLATAVRWTLGELADRYPGGSCEVRVPPFGVVQCLPGPRHTRGTPPNVVEADPQTWLLVATGGLGWAAALADGRLTASGERADLSELLPLDCARPGSGLASPG